jgi:hypothetical protein
MISTPTYGTMAPMEISRVCWWTAHNQLCAVRSGFLNYVNIYEPVAVPIVAQIGEKPDRTGLQNTSHDGTTTRRRDGGSSSSSKLERDAPHVHHPTKTACPAAAVAGARDAASWGLVRHFHFFSFFFYTNNFFFTELTMYGYHHHHSTRQCRNVATPATTVRPHGAGTTAG